MKYTKKFEEHTDYTQYTNGINYTTPNVSICLSDDHVHIESRHDYRKDYLTFEAVNDDTEIIFKESTDNPDETKTIEVSKDKIKKKFEHYLHLHIYRNQY